MTCSSLVVHTLSCVWYVHGEGTPQRLHVLTSDHSGQSYLGVSQETLYQAVAMVDRVLEKCCIPVHRVQLLAVTCLLIASKLEEQQPVEVSCCAW